MPRNAAPRKPYRPRAIARPVLERMRRDLILPAYLHLGTLTRATDAEEQSGAMSTLIVLVNYMSRALSVAGRDVEPVERAKAALLQMIDRHDRHGVYRPTGGELIDIRRAVEHCDTQLPYLDTRRLTEALLYVDRKMVEMGVTE